MNVIDFETTGLDDYRTNSRKDLPVSIGALIADFKDDKTIECKGSLYSLIRIPDPSWSKDTKFIHNLSEEEVAGAPEPSKVCEEYLKFKRNHGFERAAAWNYRFDEKHLGRLFEMANEKAPTLNWTELQPAAYTSLKTCIPSIKCDCIRNLSSHHALFDCALELCVYSEKNGYNLDVPSLMGELEAWNK